MTEEQAQEVTTLIRAATADTRVDIKTLQYFEAALLNLEYDLALSAASVGTITWRRFPSWAEFKEIYRAHKRLAEPVGEQRSEPDRSDNEALSSLEDNPSGALGDGGKRGDHAAEWVHVWSWCRLQRSPRNLRGFPQQTGWSDPKDTMSMDEYDKLRDEWVAAGSPKSKNPLPMAR